MNSFITTLELLTQEGKATALPELASLFREVPAFPPYSNIANGDLYSLSLSHNNPNLTHGFHRFPAKYVPRVPGWVIDQFAQRGNVVLDPFCGSGTTLVEGLLRAQKMVGIDCDPLACLISRAKTSPVDPLRMRAFKADLQRLWTGPATRLVPPMPDLDNFGHWFSESSWGYLQSLRLAIGKLPASYEEIDFLHCVLSSILRWVSNADDQTQKTYVSGTLKKHPPDVEPTFYRALDKAIAGLEELEAMRHPESTAQVLHGDAANIELSPDSVDLIVTSPPYLDSVDYMYNFMLEYFWLGPILGVETRKSFNQKRRSVTGAKNPSVRSAPLPDCLHDLISEKDIAPSRIAATRAYCTSMAQHFKSASKVLKKGGYYFLIVGNSQTQKGMLPIHDSLIRLAADAGFAFENSFAYRIRRHYMKFPRAGRGGIITMDWVIALKNTRSANPYPARLPMPAFTLRSDEVAN